MIIIMKIWTSHISTSKAHLVHLSLSLPLFFIFLPFVCSKFCCFYCHHFLRLLVSDAASRVPMQSRQKHKKRRPSAKIAHLCMVAIDAFNGRQPNTEFAFFFFECFCFAWVHNIWCRYYRSVDVFLSLFLLCPNSLCYMEYHHRHHSSLAWISSRTPASVSWPSQSMRKKYALHSCFSSYFLFNFRFNCCRNNIAVSCLNNRKWKKNRMSEMDIWL